MVSDRIFLKPDLYYNNRVIRNRLVSHWSLRINAIAPLFGTERSL
ncbi:hypothetical protein [Nostoc sp. 'Lobaria pulmonaria (5183) cyanobiont']|nr:hypothetical protein [Nostoc sp. 'Lobaria pulmonaria (5183) cyanobiont']